MQQALYTFLIVYSCIFCVLCKSSDWNLSKIVLFGTN